MTDKSRIETIQESVMLDLCVEVWMRVMTGSIILPRQKWIPTKATTTFYVRKNRCAFPTVRTVEQPPTMGIIRKMESTYVAKPDVNGGRIVLPNPSIIFVVNLYYFLFRSLLVKP